MPPNLKGEIDVKLGLPPLNWPDLEAKYKNLNEYGGSFSNPDCKARHRVAIIIPFANRDVHLRKLLDILHPMLQRQQLNYGIFVIEQLGNLEFNKGLINNIGYEMVRKLNPNAYDCIIYQDVDTLPENDQNMYSCPINYPRHMAVSVSKYGYRLQEPGTKPDKIGPEQSEIVYTDYFGGVFAISNEHFELINGFSNRFWGWGFEDTDIRFRMLKKGLKITRPKPDIARYKSMPHPKAKANPDGRKVFEDSLQTTEFTTDGLNSLNGLFNSGVYEIQTIKKFFTHTLISVNVMKKN